MIGSGYKMTDKGYLTSRHRRYLKLLNKDHDPKINGSDAINTADILDESVIVQCKRRSSRLRGVAASKPKTVKVIKSNNMGSEMSAPITADIRVEINGNKLEVKEITTTEKCDENCECRKAAKKQAYRARRKAYRVRRKARRLAEKLHLENVALEANPQPGGSREGNTNFRNGTASNQGSRRPQPSIPAKQAKL